MTCNLCAVIESPTDNHLPSLLVQQFLGLQCAFSPCTPIGAKLDCSARIAPTQLGSTSEAVHSGQSVGGQHVEFELELESESSHQEQQQQQQSDCTCCRSLHSFGISVYDS